MSHLIISLFFIEGRTSLYPDRLYKYGLGKRNKQHQAIALSPPHETLFLLATTNTPSQFGQQV